MATPAYTFETHTNKPSIFKSSSLEMNYRRAVVHDEGVVHSSRPPGHSVCFADYLHIDEMKPLSLNIIKVSL